VTGEQHADTVRPRFIMTSVGTFTRESIENLDAENQRLRDALEDVFFVAKFDSKPYRIARDALRGG
jgi:hypothetical protein